MRQNTIPNCLTLEEVAQALAVTPRTARRYIELGLLPARRFSPRTLRILQSDLADFLEAQRLPSRITQTPRILA